MDASDEEETVLRDTLGQISVEWQIKKIFDLPTTDNYFLDSPSFLLSDAKWFLRFNPNGCEINASAGFISLYLWKKQSQNGVHIDYEVGVNKADGSVFKSFDVEECEFKKEAQGKGMHKFLQRTDLLASKDDVAPKGILTVFCHARLYDERNVEENKTISPTPSAAAGVEGICQRQGVEKSRSQQSVETLLENFKKLFLSGRQSDVTIRVQDKEFVAHRQILAARSSVFRAMFKVDMMERNSSDINIDDCDPNSFESFLLFLYTGKVDFVSAQNALGLYSTADKYDAKLLKEECSECLAREISVDSVCDVVYLATLHDETELLNIAIQFFIDNANIIVTTHKWFSFMVEHPTLANELLVKMTNKVLK